MTSLVQQESSRVKLRGRSGVEYAEGNRKLNIGSEFLSGDAGIVIYSDSITSWDPPHDNESLAESDLVRIKANVLVDLGNQKIKAEWA